MAVQGALEAAPLTLDEFAELLGVLVGVIIFITLIGVDTFKALKRGAYWIPGDALVLTALTIQLLNLLNGQSNLLKQLLDNPQALNGEVVKNNLIMIHSSRLMLCVLVAYLLPGMARPGSEDSWGKLAALGLSIFLHISSELFSVHRRFSDSGLSLVSNYFYFWPHAKEITEGSFIVSGVIISLSLVWLILLLSSAIIANKSIRDIIRQRIPKILALKSNGTEYSWPTVEHQVLKSCIIAHACYPEHIIARSVLAASAALVITICILSSVIGWLVQGPIVILFDYAGSRLKFITTSVEIVFSLIGWAIISWRWLTSVAYYGRWRRQKEESWRSSFMVEDFWTTHILELEEAAHEKSQRRKVDDTVSKMITTDGMEMSLPGILLRCVFWLQFLVVFFSKGCFFLSELIFHNKLAVRLSSKLLLKPEKRLAEDSSEYETILDNVHILWETPRSMFVTNRNTIKQAKELMIQGNMEGKNCDTLVRFLRKYRSPGCVGISCLDLGTAQHQTGLKFLCRRDPGPALDVERNFIYASKRSWKLTAVSLIKIIVRLSPQCGEESVKAYREAGELIDLVEESDPETDNLLSKAAESLFKTLPERSAEKAPAITMEEAAAAINDLAQESEIKAEVIGHGQDSLDWKTAAAGNALYKLCKSIDCGSGNFTQLINELQSALADVIGACMQKVRGALMDNCMKWAQDLEESKLLTAVYTAGKCRGLMEALEPCPDVDIAPTAREPTTMV
jgi:hypothetical protein